MVDVAGWHENGIIQPIRRAARQRPLPPASAIVEAVAAGAYRSQISVTAIVRSYTTY